MIRVDVSGYMANGFRKEAGSLFELTPDAVSPMCQREEGVDEFI